MTRLPGALFVVDTMREHIAIREAKKLNIPIFAMVDTNSDPKEIDFVIPSNDDASKSIEKILSIVTNSIADALEQRKKEKEEIDAVSSEGEIIPDKPKDDNQVSDKNSEDNSDKIDKSEKK